jgi:hypothetical protein
LVVAVVPKLLAAWSLMAVCVVIHATGMTVALRRWRGNAAGPQEFWAWTRLFVLLAGWMVLLHLVEIGVWASFYVWQDAMPDMPAALYFSAVTYTTTGYGDLVLPDAWRLVAIEALTGILMCGWSTGFFFAALSRSWK